MLGSSFPYWNVSNTSIVLSTMQGAPPSRAAIFSTLRPKISTP